MKQSTFHILILVIFLAALLIGADIISFSASAVNAINGYQSSGPSSWMFASGGTGNAGGAPNNAAAPSDGAGILGDLRKFFDNVTLPFLTEFTHK